MNAYKIYADVPFLNPNEYGRARFDSIFYESQFHPGRMIERKATTEEDLLSILEPHLQSRLAYLQWVEDWKDGYFALSQKIKEAKHNRKFEKYDGSWQSSWQSAAYVGKTYARKMLEMRKLAKKASYAKKLAAQQSEREAVVA